MQSRLELNLLGGLYCLLVQPISQALQYSYYVYLAIRPEQNFEANFSADLLFSPFVGVIGLRLESDLDRNVRPGCRWLQACSAVASAACTINCSIAKASACHDTRCPHARAFAMRRTIAVAASKSTGLHGTEFRDRRGHRTAVRKRADSHNLRNRRSRNHWQLAVPRWRRRCRYRLCNLPHDFLLRCNDQCRDRRLRIRNWFLDDLRNVLN